MKLTDTAIRALKPREKLYRVADGHGLMIEVTPNGSKLWRYRYSWAGKEQMLALGVYPLTGLRAVREVHLELRRQLASGVSPSRARIKPVEFQRAQDGTMFKAVAMDWLDERRKDTKPKTLQKMETILKGDLIPEIGSESIATLSTPQVVVVLKKIQKRAPHMAQKARTYVNQIILTAVQRGLREDGKALSLKGAVKLPKAKSVPAALTDESQGLVMLKVSEYPDPVVRAALWMTAYTVLRPGNVVQLRWDMLDASGTTFELPPEIMKTEEEHFVPIPLQAQKLIEEAKSWSPKKRDYIFPPLMESTTPHLHRDTLSKALRESGLRGQHVPHGFRAAFRSRAREKLTKEVDVLEAQLAHSKGDATDRAYDRTRFLDERREVMQRWADHLNEVLASARLRNK